MNGNEAAARLAEIYDLYHDDDATAELAGYTALLPEGGRLLELGCGTGRLLLPLLASGCDACGVERDAAMLARLHRKAGERALAIGGRVLLADFLRELPPGPFHLAIAPLNLLRYLDDLQRQALLARLEGVVVPGGRLAAHLELDGTWLLHVRERLPRRVAVRDGQGRLAGRLELRSYRTAPGVPHRLRVDWQDQRGDLLRRDDLCTVSPGRVEAFARAAAGPAWSLEGIVREGQRGPYRGGGAPPRLRLGSKRSLRSAHSERIPEALGRGGSVVAVFRYAGG